MAFSGASLTQEKVYPGSPCLDLSYCNGGLAHWHNPTLDYMLYKTLSERVNVPGPWFCSHLISKALQPIKQFTKHWPVLGPSLQRYGQTAPWFSDGKSATPTSCLNVTHLEVKRRFWMSHFKQSGVWMILLLYGKKFCILYRDMIAVLQEYNIHRHYQTKPW